MAVGDRSEKRLFGPTEVATSDTTVATVPASRLWVVKQLMITNTNGVDAWVTLSIGAASATPNCFFYRLPVAANDTVVFDTALVMSAAETINGEADRSGVNVLGVGWEKEV
jgi:hypothetical protein